MKRILIYGSCWPTNIGNAFIHIGQKQVLREVLPEDANVLHFGGMSTYLFWRRRRLENHLILLPHPVPDYVVIGGMTQCESYFTAVGPMLRRASEQGSKIVILGGGAERYSAPELRRVREMMSGLNIHAFVSRDSYSYEGYGDLARLAHDGLDSAFFVSEAIQPVPFDFEDFIVLAFDSSHEPQVMNEKNGRPQRGGGGHDVIDAAGMTVVRTHHTCWPEFWRPSYFEKAATLVSDLPTDYLYLYARAHTVYSDRVHACIPTLAFGKRARWYCRQSPRIGMFERIGAEGITLEPTRCDLRRLEQEKALERAFLKTVFEVNESV